MGCRRPRRDPAHLLREGRAPKVERDGYKVVRKAGRYAVFRRPQRAAGPAGAVERDRRDLERRPVLLAPLDDRQAVDRVPAPRPRRDVAHGHARERAPGEGGELLESRIAPAFYRRTPIVTLSESSKAELVHDLGFRPGNVAVVPPGIHPRFTAGGARDKEPLVCAVGRSSGQALRPVDRGDGQGPRAHPTAKLVIVGEGYERPVLEDVIRRLDATDWVSLPGRLGDHEVIDLYRRSWLVASGSAREGWGMTATEAAACGTPSVMTDIAGHRRTRSSTARPGSSRPSLDDLADKIARVLGDEVLRKTLAEGALERATGLTWDATASGAFEVLAVKTARRARR